MDLHFVILFACFAGINADYACICNNDVELEVLDGMSDTDNAIGTLYQNECKELVHGVQVNVGWVALAFQHKIGYVQTSNKVVPKQCTGNPPDADKVTQGISTVQPGTIAPPGNTNPPMTSPTGVMTSTTGMMTTSLPTTTSGGSTGIISGNTKLCPLALQSFTTQDGGYLGQYDKSCYEVVPHRHSWNYAENDCKTKGGHLVDITTQAEQDFLQKFLTANYPHNVWIGLHDKQQEGNFMWITGDAVSYTNWLPGRTTTYHTITDCAYLRPQNGGYWNEGECGNGPIFVPHAYICQYDVDTSTHPDGNNIHGDGDTKSCPTSIQQHASTYQGILGQHGSSCYELLPRYKVSWSHGEQLCKQHGGHLAHIESVNEQDFIQQFLNSHMSDHAVWIGLNDRTQENHFEWSNGSPVTYTNWAKDHENNFQSHHYEDCALFIPYQSGHWDDVTCGQNSYFGDAGETHPIICQFSTSGPQIIG